MRYYDHATNVGGANAAKGTAIARAARECRAEGDAWTVYFTDNGGERCWWSGDRHTALSLAKQFTAPGHPFPERADVRLVAPFGREYDHDAVRAAKF